MNSSAAIGGSIIIAGALIAGAVLVSAQGGNPPSGDAGEEQIPLTTVAELGIRDLEASDFVLGSRDADIFLIEYSDLECPFCAQIHPTLEQIVEESNGEIAWVYRHFPLTQIHPNAFEAAVVSECVVEQLGNEGFWSYADAVFGANQPLNSEFLAEIAVSIGADGEVLAACTEREEIADMVEEDSLEAQFAGGQGTPFVIVVNRNGDAIPFSGALPRATIQTIIDASRDLL